MEKMDILRMLCYYDPRNPDGASIDEREDRKPEAACYCDNCFYGRSKLASYILQQSKAQTSLFSYSTDGDYRGTLQIVAENLACANTALVHFLDEEEMGQADPPMSADDWALTFVCPVGGDIKRIDGNVTIPQGESVVLDYDWMKI
jgi:hypothetical protein